MSLKCEHNSHSTSLKHSDHTGIWGTRVECPECGEGKTMTICGLWLEYLEAGNVNLRCPNCNHDPKLWSKAFKKVWKMED